MNSETEEKKNQKPPNSARDCLKLAPELRDQVKNIQPLEAPGSSPSEAILRGRQFGSAVSLT